MSKPSYHKFGESKCCITPDTIYMYSSSGINIVPTLQNKPYYNVIKLQPKITQEDFEKDFPKVTKKEKELFEVYRINTGDPSKKGFYNTVFVIPT